MLEDSEIARSMRTCMRNAVPARCNCQRFCVRTLLRIRSTRVSEYPSVRPNALDAPPPLGDGTDTQGVGTRLATNDLI